VERGISPTAAAGAFHHRGVQGAGLRDNLCAPKQGDFVGLWISFVREVTCIATATGARRTLRNDNCPSLQAARGVDIARDTTSDRRRIAGITVADLARDGLLTVNAIGNRAVAQLTVRGSWFARTIASAEV
jgi:hypothetical protein